MTPGTYNFPTHRRGDTFNGVQFEITQNGDPVDFTDAVVKIQFRQTAASKKVAFQWLTSDGTITVSGNTITMTAREGSEMDIAPGSYDYDVQVVLASGVTNTYVEGIMKIVNDITR